jgi:putative transposase
LVFDSFEIRCWNGERVQVAFSLDCCDREAMRWVATTAAITGEMIRDLMAESIEHRFGASATNAPHPVQWLSDNGPPYTAHETRAFGESLGFLVCTTPSYSPASNGMAEAFVKTFKRDYVYLNKLESAQAVLSQLGSWFDDYNEVHPHRGLRMRSPREFLRNSATHEGVRFDRGNSIPADSALRRSPLSGLLSAHQYKRSCGCWHTDKLPAPIALLD